MSFRGVVAYAPENMSTLGLALVSEVFTDRSHLGLPVFDLMTVTETPGLVRTDLGLTQHIESGLGRLSAAELVVLLPGGARPPAPSPAVVEAIQSAHRHGAIIAAFGAGSYLLAATGLLDGRRATTHWSLTAGLAARFPKVKVVHEPLYVDEGRLVTGAGGAAGLDMLLHLLRREHGSLVANTIARELAPYRDTKAAPLSFACRHRHRPQVPFGADLQRGHTPATNQGRDAAGSRAGLGERSADTRTAICADTDLAGLPPG
ncbi:GlxA family transcriptional regulator [Actinomadura rudentiformis]|uniref:AraC family transcriptional regulator n=1 Tax=Actinomadura rudentiformis TaxID=359158 RepID=A0A6H9YMY7_9ACTN|nr:AraC family transcriptional regulator [Actinomadura rudentiformis]KAB2340156.1 AraC family transcriptional regulator [Actinomadura rudentiformis]